MQALVAGSPVSRAGKHVDIRLEFDEVLSVRWVLKGSRKRLLQVLHSTRALDSTLKEFTDMHGCCPSPPSLGSYLHALKSGNCSTRARISEAERRHYQAKIVTPRNEYMHEAGRAPVDDSEVLSLLAEMEACLQRVLSL